MEVFTLQCRGTTAGSVSAGRVLFVNASPRWRRPCGQLMLAANEIENTEIDTIVATLEKHPSVTHIDLSNNPLSRTAAKKLQYLVQRNPCIQRIDLHGTAPCFAGRRAGVRNAQRGERGCAEANSSNL